MSAILIVLTLVIPAGADDESGGKITFGTMTGLSYVSEENRGGYNSAFTTDSIAGGLQYAQIDGILDSSFDALKKRAESDGLKYLLVCGNLTYGGEFSNLSAVSQRLKDFESDTGIEVIAMAGGGDINNPNASTLATGEREYVLTANSGNFRSLFGDLGYDHSVSEYRSESGTSAALSYSAVLDNYRIIAIDASYYQYKDGFNSVSGRMSEGLLDWVKDQCREAESLGQVPIGLCSWSLNSKEIQNPEGVLVNADEALNVLADSGMRYIFTGGLKKNDVSALVSDSGNIIYDISTAPITSFPNTFRTSDFEGSAGTFNIVDCDETKPVVSHDGIEYEVPYRETSSLKIQYCDYDLAEYLRIIIKNYVGTILIPGVNKSGSLDEFIRERYGVTLKDYINEQIGGGLTILNSIIIFDASNIMNMLEDMFKQARETFLQDDETLANLCYKRFKTALDAEISPEPCDAFLDAYGFGSSDHGGTLNDFILSLTVYSKYGNEDSSNDKFINDVVKNLETGELVTFLGNLLGETLIRDLLFEDIFSKIELKPEYLLFLDDTNESLGYYLGLGFKGYLALHGEDSSVTGAFKSILKDGFLREYGTTIDEVVDNFIKENMSGEKAVNIGGQTTNLVKRFATDSDPKELGDFNVSYSVGGASEVYVTREDFRLPSMITVTPGDDSKTEAFVTWYTKSTVKNSDIEIYSDKNAEFYGRYYIGVDGVNIITEESPVDRTYTLIDLGFAKIGSKTLNLLRHTVKITGLKPSLTYFLRVGDGEKNWWSDTVNLSTSGEGDAFSFIQVSDTSGGTVSDFNTFYNILDCADYLYPDSDFIIHTGNYVNDATDCLKWQNLLDVCSDKLLSTYIIPAAGSLDTKDTINDNFSIASLLGDTEKSGAYYSFDYNNAHIAVLDSNDLDEDGNLSEAQSNWFSNDMSKAAKQWRIVVVNKNAYGGGQVDGNTATYRQNITALMDKYNVDLVLSGGDDVYYRTDSMKNGEVTDRPKSSFPHETTGALYKTIGAPKGTVYLSGGSSGANAYSTHTVSSPSFPESGAKLVPDKPMFTAFEIFGEELYITTYTLEGNRATKVDSLLIKKTDVSAGDVNFDGAVTAADARMLLRASAHLDLLTKEQIEKGDMNGDGGITALDAREVLRISAGLR